MGAIFLYTHTQSNHTKKLPGERFGTLTAPANLQMPGEPLEDDVHGQLKRFSIIAR